MYDIYTETVSGWTRDEFAAHVFGAGDGVDDGVDDGTDDVRVAVFYNSSGEFVGFVCAHIELFSHDRRMNAVFDAGACFRLGYRPGASVMMFGLREALRFKFHHPRTPLAYLTRSHSPAVYRMLTSTMPRVYPSRTSETPADVEALVSAVGARRRYAQIGRGPWVVRSCAKPTNPSRLRSIQGEPAVQFYLALNPRFADGQALLVWTPLDAGNVLGGFWRVLTGRLGR